MQPETSSLVFLQYLTTVFDNIDDAVLLIGVEPKGQYRLLMANEAFFRNTGYQRETSVGILLQEIIAPEDYMHRARQYHKVVTGKRPYTYQHWYNVPIGRQSYIIKLIPVLNAVGEVIQVASISRNTTELEMLKEKVAETTKTLETLTKSLQVR
jgi:PAS domain S-box-containing protein